jgi:hypothetical protein
VTITYCLITKGRPDLLDKCLDSLEVVVREKDVRVIIFDNGCTQSVSKRLLEWSKKSGDQSHYIRLDINTTDPQIIWTHLKKFDIDWITFPGDDDIVRPDFLQVFRDLTKANPQLNTIASSMNLIDSKGAPMGQYRNPTKYSEDDIQYLASSLHEPPFLFPALFFRFNPSFMPLPKSRYVFDWWLSLNLIQEGSFLITPEVSIDYRVHKDQESALAPSRRKILEAYLVLTRFIQTDSFRSYVVSLSDENKLRFWKSIAAKTPIYGDSEFGMAMFYNVSLFIADAMEMPDFAVEIFGSLAAARGTYLRAGELASFIAPNFVSLDNTQPNFAISIARGSCPRVTALSKTGKEGFDGIPTFKVGCRHSSSRSSFLVDCDLIVISPGKVLDVLIVQITQTMENKGILDFKITPIERNLLRNFRILKLKLPSKIFIIIRRIIIRSN